LRREGWFDWSKGAVSPIGPVRNRAIARPFWVKDRPLKNAVADWIQKNSKKSPKGRGGCSNPKSYAAAYAFSPTEQC